MAIDDWKVLRKKWTTARDAAKPAVPKGAVKGVSIGDSIDAVYKAAQKDYRSLKTAIDKLQVATTKYKAAIKTKNAALVAWIDKNIDEPAKNLEKQVLGDVAKLKDVVRFYGPFNMKEESHFPRELNSIAIRLDGKSMEDFANAEFLELVEATMFYGGIAKMLTQTADGLVLDLPTRQIPARLKAAAKSIDHNVAIMNRVIDASKGATFAKVLRPEVGIPDMLWQNAIDGYTVVTKAMGAKTA
jgi:hypothetical protein